MLVLCAVDLALITGNIAVNGRFDGYFFVAYYPSLAMFAMVFSSLWLILAWVTATAVSITLWASWRVPASTLNWSKITRWRPGCP